MSNSSVANQELTLKVAESSGKDVGRGFARIDPDDMAKLGLDLGEMVEVQGSKTTVCKLLPSFKESRGKGRIQIDGIVRENAGAGLGDAVVIRPVQVKPAKEIVVDPQGYLPSDRDLQYIGNLLNGLAMVTGDRLRAMLFGNRHADFLVKSTSPEGPVVVMAETALKVRRARRAQEAPPAAAPVLSYEDIGGLHRQLDRIREIVELPMKYPELFDRLGIEAPKGVLLLGPPGCGKTLIARAVAHETDANFFSVNGPEIIHKFYGESEAHLRKIWDEATRRAPSIIFLDEIDAIAPRRERAVGDVEKRVVAQLLALMDGLSQREHVIVLAATNLPNVLDPALRRPGRFDREISIPIPDQNGRQEILEIHSRGMPLAEEQVDLNRLAEITHGFVGADLEALTREAGMIALRRILPQVDFSQRHVPYELLTSLRVTMEDFQGALLEVSPSAMREVFVEVPNVGWDDVGGLEDVKHRLREAVEWPMKYSALFDSYRLSPPKGLLLSGPPGCGKTLLAKALAAETEVNFISIKGPELMSMYVGESERGVREVFLKARQAAPCILFFDEIDALAATRAAGGHEDSGVGGRVLSQFLTELDGIEELKGVLVLAATNRRDLLDPALLRPGRFDLQVDLPLPDAEARAKIFEVHLRERPVASNVTLESLAEQSGGLSGAEIEAVCHRSMMEAVAERIDASPEEPDTEGIEISEERLATDIRKVISQSPTIEHA